MGGSLFTVGATPLFTPRMPFEVYVQIRDRCQEILRKYYSLVDTPIEAPKKDYGDVDILVACPLPGFDNALVVSSIAEAFAARQSSSGHGSLTSSFALPWPGEAEKDELEKFVQVDVMVCRGKQGWDWEMFHKAHGDLWNLLGSTIRKYGLTVNDSGLYLRIKEIELIDRKKSMIFLTDKPGEVLEFLGMDQEKWKNRFADVQKLYEYAASCRLFWAKEKIEELDEDKKSLKHNDRKRMNHRPIFKRWVEEFIPYCREHRLFTKEAPAREQITQEAFDRFSVKSTYDEKLQAWRHERYIDDLWKNVIKAEVPLDAKNPERRAAAVRGLKAIILEGDYSDGVIPARELKRGDESYDVDEVIAFVRSNWAQVGEIGLVKHAKRASEGMETKRPSKV